jgi:hypothetical protein
MTAHARNRILALATTFGITAFLVGAGATSASATTPEHLTLSWSAPNASVFTLPTTDGFDDSTSVNVTSNKGGTVDISYKRLSGHGGGAFEGIGSFVLGTTASGYAAQVGYTDTGLTAGSWQLSFKVNGVTKTTVVKIGSGVATSVKVTTTPSKVFVNSTAGPHVLTPHVIAKDEVGTALPIASGTLSYQDSHGDDQGTETFKSPNMSTPDATPGTLTITGNHSGLAKVKVSDVQGPVLSAHPPSDTIHPELSTAKLTSVSVTPSFATLYPNGSTEAVDNIVVDVKNNAGVTLPLTNSSVTITKSSLPVKSSPLSNTGKTTATWDGLNGSDVVAGTYKVKVIGTLQNGNTLTKSIDLKVSAALPVERTVAVVYPGSDFTAKDTHGNFTCVDKGSALDCVSKSTESGDTFHTVSVPKAVLALAKPLGYSGTIAVDITGFTASGGTASYVWGNTDFPYSDNVLITGDGAIHDGPETADNASTMVGLSLNLNDAVSLDLSKFTVTYFYWALP